MNQKVENLVSVIIPVHNRFEYARLSIKSVIYQVYEPIEIIVIDDYSDIPFEYQFNSTVNRSLKIYRLNRNRGPGYSREFGRLIASGDFISYLDSDDWWHKEKISRQVRKLGQFPDAGMCYCVSERINMDDGTRVIRKFSDQSFSEFLPISLNSRPWATGSSLWTKKATEKIGPWFEGFGWEDVQYEVRAGLLGISIVHEPNILCYIREKKQGEKDLLEVTKRLESKVFALLSVRQLLIKYNWLPKREIKQNLIYEYFNTAQKMININNIDLFVVCMRELMDFSSFIEPANLVLMVQYIIWFYAKKSNVAKKIGSLFMKITFYSKIN